MKQIYVLCSIHRAQAYHPNQNFGSFHNKKDMKRKGLKQWSGQGMLGGQKKEHWLDEQKVHKNHRCPPWPYSSTRRDSPPAVTKHPWASQKPKPSHTWSRTQSRPVTCPSHPLTPSNYARSHTGVTGTHPSPPAITSGHTPTGAWPSPRPPPPAAGLRPPRRAPLRRHGNERPGQAASSDPWAGGGSHPPGLVQAP